MSKFTKTMIASALAIAVAGPAAADVPTGDLQRYEDGKAKVSLKPSGCKSVKDEFNAVVGFGDAIDFDGNDFPFAGCWAMTGYSYDDVATAEGLRIARTVDKKSLEAKEVTMSLSEDTLYNGIVDAMDEYLFFDPDAAKCNYDDDGTLWDKAYVKKAQGKFSKNQEKLKIDIQVDSQYKNDKGKFKNVKVKITSKLDAAVGANPAFDCGQVVIQPLI